MAHNTDAGCHITTMPNPRHPIPEQDHWDGEPPHLTDTSPKNLVQIVLSFDSNPMPIPNRVTVARTVVSMWIIKQTP